VECDLACGLAIAHRLQEQISHSRLLAENTEISYSISIGLCECRDNESFDSTYRRADKALYLAKLAGRNSVISLEQ
jgi:diguanylate cyclase (GGDEF)-like protein